MVWVIGAVWGQRSYRQDSPSLQESSHNQDSTHRWLPCSRKQHTRGHVRILLHIFKLSSETLPNKPSTSCPPSSSCFEQTPPPPPQIDALIQDSLCVLLFYLKCSADFSLRRRNYMFLYKTQFPPQNLVTFLQYFCFRQTHKFLSVYNDANKVLCTITLLLLSSLWDSTGTVQLFPFINKELPIIILFTWQ